MVLTALWATFAILSALFATLNHTGAAVTTAALEGAQAGIQLSVSIAGALCLWAGVGALMEKLGLTALLAKLFRPLLERLFPSSRRDSALARCISANFCANLLGLGNAATPMGIQAVRRLRDPRQPERATDEMCRLVVLNSASIQLLPTTAAAVRAGCGAASPFDLLPCVWVSSLLSVTAGLAAARLLRGRHG